MKVCVVGAGDGGATASNQIRRLDSEVQIDVFNKRANLGCPPCPMVLVLSGEVATWDDLIRGFRETSFWEKRNINLHLNTEVTDIVRDEKYIVVGGRKYEYDKLILALGAAPVIPSVAGLDGKNEFTLSTDMADGMLLDNTISRYSEAAIIGGGFIALEIATALKARGYSKVYLLVRRGILRTYLDEDMTEKVEDIVTENGVELILPASIENIVSEGIKKRITLSDRELEVDFVLYGPRGLIAVEVKRSANVHPKTLRGLKEFKKDYPPARCYLFYGGSTTLYMEDIIVLPIDQALHDLEPLLLNQNGE